MASAEELKTQISCHDMADALGLVRGKGHDPARKTCLYHAPHHDDSSPSLAVFKGGRMFKDHSADGEPGSAGSCIDLVMWCKGVDFREAVDWIHETFGLQRETRQAGPPRPATLEESVAARCLKAPEAGIEWLRDKRGIPEDVSRAAWQAGSLGYDDWTNPKRQPGEFGHGGPGAAFVVRTPNPGHIRAVDYRYFDPDTAGGKTKSLGEKVGTPWTSSWREVERARTVYVVESAINALSVEACAMPATAAIATRGLTVEETDWRVLAGKQVVICMDVDRTTERGARPGPQAAWRLYEILTGQNIAAFLVDEWPWLEADINDVNDALLALGAEDLRKWLKRLDRGAIPGLTTVRENHEKQRIFLPHYDYAVYWKYRAQEDYTSYVERTSASDEGERKEDIVALAGFRIAGISRVQIQSAPATMTGGEDAQPNVQFAVSVQVARHENDLVRRVFDDEDLHNLGRWTKFGPVFEPKPFARLISILERTAKLDAIVAANFVGLCWRQGKLHVNEGSDCYFVRPDQQCPYHSLTFPRGPAMHANRVLQAFQSTFRDNAAALSLTWVLGAHLKAILGFWPHMQMQAKKASGKSTLVKRLEEATAMRVFSSQSINSEYRQVTTVSHTSHPVGWEEVSTSSDKAIGSAVQLLQQCYDHAEHRRGSDQVKFLLCAPVLLVGEDMYGVEHIQGKLVKCDLSGRKGPLLPDDLPKFPVRAWLDYLAGLAPGEVLRRFQAMQDFCVSVSRATGKDEGAARMVHNYAALLTAWELLADFARLPADAGGFRESLVEQMNLHISETAHERDPFVWILEIFLNEIAARKFDQLFAWDYVDDAQGTEHHCLVVRTSSVMYHIQTSPHLRDRWSSLPVKSDRVFKAQCRDAGLFAAEDIERSVNGARLSHAVAFSVDRLEAYGLSVPVPQDNFGGPQPPAQPAFDYDDDVAISH